MSALRVVVAPDSFKGSATAVEVAQALAAGWRAARPGDEVVLAPMADGGEGTVAVFAAAVPDARRNAVAVPGPAGRPIVAEWLLLPDGTAVVELASASGMTLGPLRPLTAHTRGFGRVIAAALDAGARSLLLAIGGSASTDGGVGALRELGARFLTLSGHEVGDGGGSLLDLAVVERRALRPVPAGGVQVLCDVTNPLLGDAGAARVFGPQKGARPEEVVRLDAGLRHLAGRLDADPEAAGAGAAGGTGFGLLAWGARLVPGAAVVGEALGLPVLVAGADIVITGEGRFDAQTDAGKVPAAVLRLAEAAGARTLLVAGSIQAPTTAFAGSVSLTEAAGSASAALADPLTHLRAVASELALWSA
ncbi:glycerate kinase [Rathayibacter tanaceti]|uniref:Glycerate kinase n=2 Tax=Rathayibacter tanaceti TaxID=1671680 RepID=A0ACD2XL58_9MICO|nr:glycerate kinase [Rathayibacter tanaceti]QHC54838.1 glycerate kinase [Rathayibacter tanaceti]TCO38371.1 glycerate kinase [Rathayibacter tanaceti]